MHKYIKTDRQDWPFQLQDKVKTKIWPHSAFRSGAYLFTHELFKDLVSYGELDND